MRRIAFALVLAGWCSALAGSAYDQLVALRERLARSRDLNRESGFRAEVNFAVSHKADKNLSARTLYEVAVRQLYNDRSGAVKTLETLLQLHPRVEPYASLGAFELARLLGERDEGRSKAIRLYERFISRLPFDRVRRPVALLELARLNKAANKLDEAEQWCRGFLREFPDLLPGRAECVGLLAEVSIARKDLGIARQLIDFLQANCPWATDTRCDLLLSLAQAYRAAGERKAALDIYEALMKAPPASDSARIQLYSGLATIYTQEGKTEAAAQVYRTMANDRALSSSYRTSAFRQLFALRRKEGDNAAIVRTAYEAIAADPSVAYQYSDILGDLVDGLVAMGKTDEALGMAKAYYRLSAIGASGSSYYSSSARYRYDAIYAVIRALKAKEGGLRSANAFLRLVENGPEGPDGRMGTKDDLPNPLEKFPLPPNPERDRLFAQAARRFVNEPLKLGYLYLCWDKPLEALLAFRRYYLAAGEGTTLVAAATKIARVMRALDLPEETVEAFFDYQNYGPAGKDGRKGTGDDLKDPILALKKK